MRSRRRNDGPPSRPFRIEIPAEYSVVSAEGPFEGMLDGSRYDGPRKLTAGIHTLTSSRSEPVAILWSRAPALGFSPFVIDPRCG